MQGIPFPITLETSLFSDSQPAFFWGVGGWGGSGWKTHNISHTKVQPYMITLILLKYQNVKLTVKFFHPGSLFKRSAM